MKATGFLRPRRRGCRPDAAGAGGQLGPGQLRASVGGLQRQLRDLYDERAGSRDLAGARPRQHVQRAPTDEDWYFISLKPNSSYEIVVDGTTPFINQTSPVLLALVQANGAVVTADTAVSSRGFSRSLRVSNNTTTAIDDRWVRVTAPNCDSLCLEIDQYHISMRETTSTYPASTTRLRRSRS